MWSFIVTVVVLQLKYEGVTHMRWCEGLPVPGKTLTCSCWSPNWNEPQTEMGSPIWNKIQFLRRKHKRFWIVATVAALYFLRRNSILFQIGDPYFGVGFIPIWGPTTYPLNFFSYLISIMVASRCNKRYHINWWNQSINQYYYAGLQLVIHMKQKNQKWVW